HVGSLPRTAWTQPLSPRSGLAARKQHSNVKPSGRMESSYQECVKPNLEVDRYHLVREIGAGAMGVVFEAKHPGLGRRVALKMLNPALRCNATAAARFLREGRVAARLWHPHIVEMLDAGTCDAGPYLVMEYVDGPTLAAHLHE